MATGTVPFRDPMRRPAIACASLLGTALLLAFLGRHPHDAAMPDPQQVVHSVAIRFADAPDGTVIALNAATGAEIERIAPGKGGFVRVTMRSFASERKQHGIGGEVPFQLSRMADGDLMLSDDQTGRVMMLNAFGPSNSGAFASMLDQGASAK